MAERIITRVELETLARENKISNNLAKAFRRLMERVGDPSEKRRARALKSLEMGTRLLIQNGKLLPIKDEPTLESQVYALIVKIGQPVRVPTLTWLAIDCFNTLDNRVRVAITNLINDDSITCDNGGWIRIKPIAPVAQLDRA